MSSRSQSNTSSLVGYSLGAGLAFIPLLGIPLRFAFAQVDAWLIYGGAFLLGALAAVIYSFSRGAR